MLWLTGGHGCSAFSGLAFVFEIVETVTATNEKLKEKELTIEGGVYSKGFWDDSLTASSASVLFNAICLNL
ncbi:hypothetical protein PIB30_083280 [Stylosanthes scabra]|uniref:Uncharacterized protein n=1 Tax=Stylosanthes scabra TaxID=79078 RepID=A0ABU6WQH2_9FABA|nr:hypothetical protein [Stylosanthes scabra]